MFNTTSHPYMDADHVVALNMLLRSSPELAQPLNALYRQAKNLLEGKSSPDPAKFICRRTEQGQNRVAVVIWAETGLFVQLAVRPEEAQGAQLSAGKFSLMSTVDQVRSTSQIKVWT